MSKIIRNGQGSTPHIQPFLVPGQAATPAEQGSLRFATGKVIRGEEACAFSIQTFAKLHAAADSKGKGSGRRAPQTLASRRTTPGPASDHNEPGSDCPGGHPGEATQTEATGAMERERLLQQARAEAERHLAEAQAQGVRLQAEAYREGHQQGMEAGEKAGTEALQPVLATFRQVTEDTARLRADILRQAEEDIVTLAFHLARKILHQEVQGNPQVITSTLRHALTHAVEQDEIVVRVNPADLQQALEAQQELVQGARQIKGLTILGDDTVGRGGCRLEATFGDIDADLEAQMLELEQRYRERLTELWESETP